jgi:putative DNA primase/helicase
MDLIDVNEERRAKEIDDVSEALSRAKSGKPYNSPLNLERVLKTDPFFGRQIRRNEFTGESEWDGAALTDEGATFIRLAIGRTYGFTPTIGGVMEMVRYVAEGQPYHPVRDWLGALTWDGIERLDYMLETYAGAEGTPLNRELGRRFMVSAVARVFQPGCKVDTILILAGPQGAGKSTFFRTLAGAPWFSDTPIDLRSKDAYLALRGVWLYEMAELASMRPREAETVKAFLSAQIDRFRKPYGHAMTTHRRQCVFVGTTNEHGFLKDPTGARRFWPVSSSGRMEVLALQRDREQLWAEAAAAYRNRERWWLELNSDLELQEVHRDFEAEDPWTEAIRKWIEGWHADITTEAALSLGLDIEAGRQTRTHEIRIGGVLARLGYQRRRIQRDRVRRYVYVRDQADGGEP